MAQLTIKSRLLNREFTFFMPDGGGFIRLEDGRNHGTLGTQICRGGGFKGETLEGSDEYDFKSKCLNWYRQHKES
mgnify:CR=1 FL=1